MHTAVSHLTKGFAYPYIHVAMVVARDTILAVMMIDDGHDNNDGNGDMVMLMINTSTSHQSNPWTPIP